MSPRRVLNPVYTNAMAARRVMTDLVLNFVAMATGIGRGWIWMTPFNSPTLKTLYYRRKHLGDILYRSWVIADFASNFVAIATGVGRGRICLASFNSPSPKTPCYTLKSRGHLLYKPSYSRFCLKFCCHGNRGHPGVNLNDAVKLAVPEYHTLEPKSTTLSCVQSQLWQFK